MNVAVVIPCFRVTQHVLDVIARIGPEVWWISANYETGLAARMLSKSHALCGKVFGPDRHFSRVLEVGAGTGIHVRSVRHSFDEYVMTDLNPPMLDQATSAAGESKGGALCSARMPPPLRFADASFDRIIATHVLEHLPNPHLVLSEWVRVLKPGGIFSIVLPYDPGMASRTGRCLGPRRKFEAIGIDYHYWMACEHINSIANLRAFLRYYFPDIRERWYPLAYR